MRWDARPSPFTGPRFDPSLAICQDHLDDTALVRALHGLAVWDRARHEARTERAAAAFAPGQTLIGYCDTEERRFQKARLAVIRRPRVVVFGSSRVMTISTTMVSAAPGELYNAGLSGGTVEDFIVLWRH